MRAWAESLLLLAAWASTSFGYYLAREEGYSESLSVARLKDLPSMWISDVRSTEYLLAAVLEKGTEPGDTMGFVAVV